MTAVGKMLLTCHERPLVLFSALVTMGAGIAAARPLLVRLGEAGFAPGAGDALLVAGLLAGGAVFSVAHLGRKRRLLRAISRTGQSALSTEVVLLALAFLGATATGFLRVDHPLHDAVWVLTALASLLLLVVLGQVYALRGQPWWTGPAVAVPCASGLAWGVLYHVAMSSANMDRARFAAILLLVADAGLTKIRFERARRAALCSAPYHPAFSARGGEAVATRILLADAAPVLALAGGSATAAVVCAGLGIIYDRALHYLLARQETTEAEAARVERVLREGDPWSG